MAITTLMVVLLLVPTSCGRQEVQQRSDLEKQAVLADQQLRDAELAVRASRPFARDLAPLLEMLGSDELRRGAIDYYSEFWADYHEVDGRIDVLRQETSFNPGGDVVVRTCERDWMNMTGEDGTAVDFKGNVGLAIGRRRTWAIVDGSWRATAEDLDANICQGMSERETR